ncbi:hypothetical protein [Cohnella faecalis]|uniref:Uncharacterized protein n=1 Tax=Cohnella faecalis TaxID=2315694 RepID=A0A398CHN1_9BACL|nr:hypothetical protein [Cohnella faecalis]RIE00619.1 hypothetical protein D3H35_27555 [Cohnella faecalis]
MKASNVDWGVVDSIEVRLEYRQPGGELLSKVLILTEQAGTLSWNIRLDDKTKRTYTYRLVHRLKDGTNRETETFSSEASLLPVDDPFRHLFAFNFCRCLIPRKSKPSSSTWRIPIRTIATNAKSS